MRDIEKGKLAVEIMIDICKFFDNNEKMIYQDFLDIQRNRSKELDKAIKDREQRIKNDLLGGLGE